MEVNKSLALYLRRFNGNRNLFVRKSCNRLQSPDLMRLNGTLQFTWVEKYMLIIATAKKKQ